MQIKGNVAADLGRRIAEQFSSTEVKPGSLDTVNQFAELDEADKDAVLQDVQRRTGSEFDVVVDNLTALGMNTGVFLQAQNVQAGQGAASAAAAPVGAASMLETRAMVNAARQSQGIDELPNDPLGALEAIPARSEAVNAAQAAIAAGAAKVTKGKGGADALEQARARAIGAAGRFQMAQDKLTRNAAKNPAGAQAVADNDAAMRQALTSALATMPGSPVASASAGSALSTSPSSPTAASASAPPAAPPTPPTPPATPTPPGGLPPGTPSAASMAADLATTSPATQARLNRSSQIMSLLNSNMPIGDLLVAVMMILFGQNDDDLREQIAKLDKKKAEATELRRQRALLDAQGVAQTQPASGAAAASGTPPASGAAAPSAVSASAPVTGAAAASPSTPPPSPAPSTAAASPTAAASASATPSTSGGAPDPSASSPDPSAAPAPALSEADRIRQGAELDAAADRCQTEIDKINFKIQELTQARQQAFDMITKIMQTFAEMAQTANQRLP